MHFPTNFTILRFHETQVWQISRVGKNHDRGIKFSLLKSSDSKLYRSVHNSIPPMWALFQKNVTYILDHFYNNNNNNTSQMAIYFTMFGNL